MPNETPQQTIDRLTAENADLKKQVAQYTEQAKQASADEIVIRQKMALGLTRDQAASVIERQRAHDKAEKEQAAAQKKADAARK